MNDDIKMGGIFSKFRKWVANNPVAAKVIGVIAVVVVVAVVAAVALVAAPAIVLASTVATAEIAGAVAGAGITTVMKQTDVIAGNTSPNQYP